MESWDSTVIVIITIIIILLFFWKSEGKCFYVGMRQGAYGDSRKVHAG